MRVIVKTYPADMEYLTLYPIGDVHYGARECREKQFTDYIQRIKADDRAAVILLGDMVNNGIRSSITNVYEEKCTPGQQKRDMTEMLRPIGDKVICAVSGNHELRSARECDVDIMRDMCDAIGCGAAYTPDMAFLKVSVGRKSNRKPATYMFVVTHGAGGGVLLGSGVNKPDGMQIRVDGIDGSISGHVHKPMKIRSPRMVFDPRNNNVVLTDTVIFVCTSWLEYGGYAAQKMLPPVAFQPDTIRLDGREKCMT